ncbi:hypothetical protein J5Y09_23725 [Roseomonas sp. PWR1]|uniref:Glycosyltransferase RgtA/B/C/D-like domain-containing protein n=1 Tax=Roseomonas nitratireducens TaxID=2820810 RepID=A0ABS4B001_9PROT|nr:hypothetical protein [Neoroseomonas nitratireducens]MBP0466958.1 hypothetical protein [Neoroseomonas nitratireducens]
MPPDPPSRIGPALVIVAILLVALIQVASLGNPAAPRVFEGALADPDAYLRLIRILDLREGAGWFDDVTPRLNAPDGLLVQWTRPVDLLILLPALLLEALAGLSPRQALIVSGIVLSPVLHAGAVVAAAWAARAIWPGSAPWHALVLAAGAPAAVTYSGFGRADHHALILLAITLAIGAALRALRPDGSGRAALAAGAALGLGVWTGPEVLLIAAPLLLATGLAAVIAEDGRELAAQGERMALGMAGIIVLAMLVEHAPAEWLVAEYDRVSIHHLSIALFAAAVFRVARIAGAATRGRRFLVAASAGGAALALLILLFPGTVKGPLGGADPAYLLHLHPTIAENRPLPPFAPGSLLEATVYAGGTALGGVLALALAYPGWRRDGRWPAGLALAAILAVGIAASFAARRFTLDLAPAAAIAAAGLLGAILHAAWPRSAALRAALGGGLFLGMLAVPFAGLFSPRPIAGAAPADAGCPWTEMAEWLAAERPGVAAGAAAPILMAGDLFMGSEIAWRAPHRSVAAPHHRGGGAIADTVAVLDATEPEAARAILARRGVSLLLTCVTTPVLPLRDGSFAATLRDGDVPSWLRPVPLPAGLSAFRLYAVVPAR